MPYSTLLQIVNRAEREFGFAASATVIDNVDEQAVQMLNLLNGLGNDLVKEHNWQVLQTEYLFSTVSYAYTGDTSNGSTTLSTLSSTTGITTNPTYFTVTGTGLQTDSNLVSVNAGAATAVIGREASATGTTIALTFSQIKYAIPSDFDRLIDRTDWDLSQRWELLGPQTGQQWQWLKSANLASGPRARFRMFGDLFVIFPAPTSERDLRFEYISTNWVATASGSATSKSSYTIDTDTAIFPDRLLIAGLKLRYAQTNGMDWLIPSLAQAPRGMDPNTVVFPMRILDECKAQDGGSPSLSLSPQYHSPLIGWHNIPDSSYGD